MKRRSNKTAAIYREWTPIRLEFVAAGPCCICGGTAHDCHEIIGGTAHRMRAFVERCCWLRTCRTCHDELQGMSKPLQLALKLISDPEGFDRGRLLDVWGRPPTAITAEEILDELRNWLIERNQLCQRHVVMGIKATFGKAA